VNDEIRFYADQHFPAPVTSALRRKGVDVLTALEAGRCGFADSDQLAFATINERVMLTFDSDYLALHQNGVHHAGIAWCPQRKYKTAGLIQALLLLHGVIDRSDMRNHVEHL
jgi:hypothetical protein